MTPARVISGGQTGADLGALRAALVLGLESGGYMPRDFRTELGPRPWMAKMYGVRQHVSPRFRDRTIANVQWADAVVVIGDLRSPGSRLTVQLTQTRPCLINPTLDQLRAEDYAGQTVLVAGNRESGNPGIEAYVYRLLIEAWAPDGTVHDRLIRSAPWPDPLPRLVAPRLTLV